MWFKNNIKRYSLWYVVLFGIRLRRNLFKSVKGLYINWIYEKISSIQNDIYDLRIDGMLNLI